MVVSEYVEKVIVLAEIAISLVRETVLVQQRWCHHSAPASALGALGCFATTGETDRARISASIFMAPAAGFPTTLIRLRHRESSFHRYNEYARELVTLEPSSTQLAQ
jgi:hypothetical protein